MFLPQFSFRILQIGNNKFRNDFVDRIFFEISYECQVQELIKYFRRNEKKFKISPFHSQTGVVLKWRPAIFHPPLIQSSCFSTAALDTIYQITVTSFKDDPQISKGVDFEQIFSFSFISFQEGPMLVVPKHFQCVDQLKQRCPIGFPY